MKTKHHFKLSAKIFAALVTCFFSFITDGKCAFTITGYSPDPTQTGVYDIFGSGLSSVTNLTISPYISQGDENEGLAFTDVSNQELTFTLSGNLSHYVDLIFSNSSYSDIELTLSSTASPVPLTTIGSGQTLNGGGGSSRDLVLSGGSYGTGSGGSNVAFIESGGTFLGFGGGGSNTIYYMPGADISTGSGGGGNVTIEVNSINSLMLIPEPSTWAMLLGGLGLLAFWRRRSRRSVV